MNKQQSTTKPKKEVIKGETLYEYLFPPQSSNKDNSISTLNNNKDIKGVTFNIYDSKRKPLLPLKKMSNSSHSKCNDHLE